MVFCWRFYCWSVDRKRAARCWTGSGGGTGAGNSGSQTSRYSGQAGSIGFMRAVQEHAHASMARSHEYLGGWCADVRPKGSGWVGKLTIIGRFKGRNACLRHWRRS